jgi:hypothetical protein
VSDVKFKVNLTVSLEAVEITGFDPQLEPPMELSFCDDYVQTGVEALLRDYFERGGNAAVSATVVARHELVPVEVAA